MLVQKKIEPKKLIIYIIIIAIMFGGAGFFVYKNNSLSSRKNVLENQPSLEKIVSETSEQDINMGESNNIEEKINLPDEIDNAEKVFDTSFFSEIKFRILKDNSVIEAPGSIPGNVNPFESYE